MGAGTSAEIRKHLLEAWEPKRKAPANLEKEVREFLQHARPLMEVHFAPHAPDAEGRPSSSSAQRPAWLEPQQLHIALIGQERLVDSFLASLEEVAPLLEVVAEEGGTTPEDGELHALEAAAQAGFRCHAFIDQDLHLLRFWALGEEAALGSGKLAIPGLRYLDLVLLLLQPKAEVRAPLPKPKPKLTVQPRRLALEAELAELRALLEALPVASPPAPSPAPNAPPAPLPVHVPALEEELELVLAELSEVADDEELKEVRARKQALIEEEDYDGAHMVKQEEKELLAALEDRKRALEDQRQDLEARLLEARSTDARSAGKGGSQKKSTSQAKQSELESALRQAQADKQRRIAEEDYDGAYEAKQREKELLEELEACKERDAGGCSRSSLEEELKQVRALKEALIRAEDYDGAHDAKEEEKKLLAELEAMGESARAAMSAVEEELRNVRARKQALIQGEDYDGAHEAKEREKLLLLDLGRLQEQQARGGGRQALEEELQQVRAKKQAQIGAEAFDDAYESKQREKELLAELNALGEQHEKAGAGKRSALGEELKEVRARKQELIEVEDYDGAHEAKLKEKELIAALDALVDQQATRGRRSTLEEELKELRAKKQALIEAEDYDGAHETKLMEKQLLAELDALAKPEAGGGAAKAKSTLEGELEHVRARKQAQIEAEDYDGAYESKLREKELLAELEALGGQQARGGTRSTLEEELKEVRAMKQALTDAEDYDGAHKAKEREKELLAELDLLAKPQAGKVSKAIPARARSALEAELEQVRARKQALIEEEDYDGAHEVKQREKELLAELTALGEREPGRAASSALEEELERVRTRKQALIEAEDYDAAHEARQREKQLLAELDSLRAQEPGRAARNPLEEELERVRARKQVLIEAEDYDGAHEVKQKEKELLAKLEAGRSPWRSPLEEELERVRAAKQTLIEAEDYDGAYEAKEREKELLAKLEKKQPQRPASESSALQQELQHVRAEKQALLEAEDYDGAHEAKQREKELLAKLGKLPEVREKEAQVKAIAKEEVQVKVIAKDPAAEERHLLEQEVERVLAKMEKLEREEAQALQDEPQLESRTVDQWSDEAAALVSKGSSPVLVATCGPASAELRAAARDQLAELGESLGEVPRFWDALNAALRTVRRSRAFPQCPDQDLGGGYSLGDWVFVKDEAHTLNGQLGVAVGFEDDGTWDFKITVRLVGGEVAQLRQDQLNPLATEVRFDVSELVQLQHMDMMWVRLKGLKSRADLNSCEGLATVYSMQKREEGYASIYDCPARHTVTLEDGTEVRAKVENFDILERERPFLQDLPGIVDALHLDGERYSVLVVRHSEQGPVTIQGLMQRPELNGQRGKVVRKDADRCIILTDVGSSEVSVKKANLVFDVPKTVAQRMFLRPQHVEEFRGLPEKPGPTEWNEDEIDEEQDERLISERLEQSRRARGEL